MRTLIYCKPDIQIIGEVIRITHGAKVGSYIDGPPPFGTQNPAPPAYDLDE